MNHRPEIDGLRFFAIFPVVAFHASIGAFSGGFVGVDVFFVISGYLITSIILSGIRDGTFTYRRFFERRARRILPALCLVILTTLVASHFLSLPENLVETAWASLAALFAVSNIFFWQQTTYFSTASEFQPLLHTWSLGVEEQFYLILPLALAAAVRLRLNLAWLFAIGLPIAFAAGLWLSYEKPVPAFYLLPARAWELGIGSAIAVGIVPKVANRSLARIIAAMGLAVLVLSFFVITPQTVFPGYAALAPCLGAAAIIHCSDAKGAVYRLLCMPALRFIGLISYSLYLWHWPVLAFARMWTATPDLAPPLSIACVALSFVLAAFTWRYVERPFRNRQMPLRRIGLVAMPVLVALLVTAGSAIQAQGWPDRLNETAQRMAAANDDIDPLRDTCEGEQAFDNQRCQFGSDTAQPSFVLIGDSHAAALRPAVEQWAIEEGRRGLFWWQGGCAMLLGADRSPDRQTERCRKFRNGSKDALADYSDIRTIFLGGRWEAAFSARRPEAGERYRIYLVDAKDDALTVENTGQVFARSLRNTLRYFGSRYEDVVLIGAVPEIGFDVPAILGLSAFHQDRNIGETLDIGLNNDLRSTLDDVFGEIAEETPSTRYISLWRHFCTPRCKLVWDGVPVYSDDDHISYSAASGPIGRVFMQEMDKTDEQPANP